MRALAPGPRAALLALAGAALWTSAPGELATSGIPGLALAGLALWAHATARPGPAATRLDLVFSTLTWGALLRGTAGVAPPAPLALGLVLGFWQALAGACLRVSARRLPLALALPAAWVGVEVLRRLAPPPLGFAWLPLGARALSVAALANAAPLLGPEGLGWLLAAPAGGLADLAGARWRRRRGRALPPILFALGPLALVAVAGTPPPPSGRERLRVLCVDAGVAVPRSRRSEEAVPAFARATRATRAALDGGAAASGTGGGPDAVFWGAGTFCAARVFAPGTEAALAAGTRAEPWQEPIDAAAVEGWRRETALALETLFDRSRGGILPEECAFVAGAELWEPDGGRIVRREALVSWSPAGVQVDHASKAHPAPGPELGLGLERHAFGRDALRALFGRVGDVVPGAPGLLEIDSGASPPWRAAAGLGLDGTRPATFVPESPADFALLALDGAEVGGRVLVQLALAAHALARSAGLPLVVAANAGPPGVGSLLDPAAGPAAGASGAARGSESEATDGPGPRIQAVPRGTGRTTFWARHHRELDLVWMAAALLATAAGALPGRGAGSDRKLR